MFSRALLLVLLGLSCLQSFTMAETAIGATECCFEFHKNPFPASKIVAYKETRSDCAYNAVIFTTKKGFRFCADLAEDWVKQVMNSEAFKTQAKNENIAS